MPITNELKSINRLEQAGFSHDQAKAVVEVLEESLQSGFERFVQVLDQRLGEMEMRLQTQMREMEARLRLEMQTMRGDLLKEQRDQMLRFAALVTLIVAVIGGVYRFL